MNLNLFFRTMEDAKSSRQTGSDNSLLERSRERLVRRENKRRQERQQNRRSKSENDDNNSDKGSRY